jgi:hypothetical protein
MNAFGWPTTLIQFLTLRHENKIMVMIAYDSY